MAAQPDPLPMEQFLHEMEEIRSSAIQDIMDGKYGRLPFAGQDTTEAKKRPEVIFFMQLGVYPEWREVHFLSRQIQRLDDADLTCRIAHQIADEARHTKVLRDQLIEWGADPDRFWQEPIPQWSGAFDYMDKLTHPGEYFACSNFIGEGLFLHSVMRPMKQFDPDTWAVYVEHILPDEPRHIQIGRDIIVKYCTTYEMQERVRRAAKTLAKQYCIGYDVVTQLAGRAREDEDPAALRDALFTLPSLTNK